MVKPMNAGHESPPGRMPGGPSGRKRLLNRDGWTVLIGLAGITSVVWLYLLVMASDIGGMSMNDMAMPTVMPWSFADFALMFLMWAVMMAAMMTITNACLGGGLLIAAGIYQWAPMKHACLENCRAPVEFLSRTWRNCAGGALIMRCSHGLYCVGCCWLVMA